MKLIAALVLLIALVIFGWRHFMNREQKAEGKTWASRALFAFIVSCVLVIALFGALSLNSWRLW